MKKIKILTGGLVQCHGCGKLSQPMTKNCPSCKSKIYKGDIK